MWLAMDGKLGGSVPDWYTVHQIAMRYHCAPRDVLDWSLEDYQQAITLASAQARADKDRANRKK